MKAGLCVFFLCTTLPAQWINLPIPGTPRTPDGKPNMTAPAPRMPDGKPDFTGLWGLNPGVYESNIANDLKPEDIKSWAADLVKQRSATIGRDNPSSAGCLPRGPHANMTAFLMEKFIQTPGVLVVLVEDMSYRQIHLDGRPLPQNPDPSFMGYWTAHWDGDTLVAEGNGFKDSIWLDDNGHPITDALHVTERFRRIDFGHVEITKTIDDPKVFNKPFSVVIKAELVPDTEILEFVCAENEKDRHHLVGTSADSRPVQVKIAPEVLAQYAGAYEFALPENPTVPAVYNVTMTGGKLFIDTEGKGSAELVPVSETTFYLGTDRFDFFKDAQGKVTHFTQTYVEGDLKYTRKPDRR